MAEHVVTVTASVDLTTGQTVQAASWPSGFDHAALVTALRSRSDGADFRLRHQTTGVAVPLAASGLNTTACKLAFALVAEIAAPGTDTYILTTGDLRNSATPFSTITGAAVGSVAMPVTAAAMPTPGFPLERFDVPDTIASDGQSFRRGNASENFRAKYRLNYPAIRAEDWYELRAIWNAGRGGATRHAIPSWLSSAAAGIVLTSASFAKSGPGHFAAELVAEEVIA